MSGESPEYMEKLTFSSQPDAADPDKKHNRFDKS
jgi:hypothetical protein